MSDPALFLQTICGLLEECGIAYMLTGSLVSSYYGDPRTTRDLDLVINAREPPDERIKKLVTLCEHEGFYVATEAALGPWSEGRRQFNIISPKTGWKADLMWVQQRPFSREEFGRRRNIDLMGIAVPVPSPEDIVLAKLEWGNNTESRQFTDAVSVLSVYKDRIDTDYLNHWSKELKIELLLAQAIAATQR
jgi:hypothetical protein